MIRLRRSRPPGRHRDGQPHTSVHRRLWDGPARDEAQRLERSMPAWLVLYSLGNRRFYAIARHWETAEPVIVCDDTAEGLEARMREEETAFARTLSVSPLPNGHHDAPSPPRIVTSPTRVPGPPHPYQWVA
ncbi:hypothetical protein [Streptosporangium carneum]|uniref:Uncharacterized protein n=1 Tax=Streptosporangium carneum TaxID=47481 RepID=A0A9W6ME01_9ACTN|nr:hypothetical protein [Streptosporangium carneum]GLK10617.1 hypothetical protein GCM10017600_40230 [Streptosporangium carneum]